MFAKGPILGATHKQDALALLIVQGYTLPARLGS